MTDNTAIDYDVLFEYAAQEARKDASILAELVFRDEYGELITESQVHLDLHRFMNDNQYGVIELPRESGKTINMLARAAHAIGHNPDIRIKIVSNTDRVAVSRVKALREVMETPIYQSIFPATEPGREWSDQRFTVKRNTISPESTCEGYGVNSKVTGGRCDLLFLDDIDDEEVVVSEVKRKRNRDRVVNVWLNLLAPQGRAYALATPWHEADTVHLLKDNGWPVFRRPVENMRSVWPERWTKELLEEKKRSIGSLAFARGWELVCITTETSPIKGPWFNTWKDIPRFTNIGIAVDPANSIHDKSAYTAIGLLGVTFNYKVYLLEVLRDRYEFPQLITTIKDLADRARTRYRLTPFIGVESTAYQNAIPQQLKRETRYPIYGLKADKSKFIRASRLAVHIENGRVYLREGLNGNIHTEHQVVYDECITFPSGQYVDCVDMLGYGVEMMLQLARKSGAVAG